MNRTIIRDDTRYELTRMINSIMMSSTRNCYFLYILDEGVEVCYDKEFNTMNNKEFYKKESTNIKDIINQYKFIELIIGYYEGGIYVFEDHTNSIINNEIECRISYNALYIQEMDIYQYINNYETFT